MLSLASFLFSPSGGVNGIYFLLFFFTFRQKGVLI